MANKIFIGTKRKIELPKKGGYLLITDDVPKIRGAKVFDPQKHGLNPLKNVDYRKAREITRIFYTIASEGETTLTVRNGKRALLRILLLGRSRLDKLLPIPATELGQGGIEALETVGDVLMSPVLQAVLCDRQSFAFDAHKVTIARLNRAEIGEDDCLALGLFLMSHYPGQIVVDDGGFYLRDQHTALIRENRLIAGCNFLRELPEKLRDLAVLQQTVAQGATHKDAEELALLAGKIRATVDYNDFVSDAME